MTKQIFNLIHFDFVNNSIINALVFQRIDQDDFPSIFVSLNGIVNSFFTLIKDRKIYVNPLNFMTTLHPSQISWEVFDNLRLLLMALILINK